MQKIMGQLATEIKIRPEQVQAAVSLLDGGATVPFIARYRKEVTGGLDDIQLRELDYRLGYLRELEDRRATILKSISDQGKLSPDGSKLAYRMPTSWDEERRNYRGGQNKPIWIVDLKTFALDSMTSFFTPNSAT
jgi:uncharacterized protein